MAEETQELETNASGTETSNNASPGGEETNAGGGETSGKDKATGNFLTDLLGTKNTEDDGAGASENGDGDQGAGDQGTEDGGEEEEDDVEIVTAGKDVAAGDVVKANGKPLINGEVQLEDGRIVKTDGEGKITEISEGEGGGSEPGKGLLELKAGDDVEKFDLSKKEDLEKVREYANKGRFFEKEMQALKQEKASFTAEVEQHQTREQALAYNVLYLQANGKLDSSEFEELPYEDFVGASEKRDPNTGEVIEEATKEGDRKLYNAHKKRIAENVKTLTDYQSAFKETAAGFNKMVNDFSTKHPEIKDVKAWINEKLGKYSAPILTYGKEKYPEDLLEMVYHWENRADIEKKIREDERRKKAKVKIVKDKGVKGSESTNRTEADNFIDDGIFSKYKRKIVS